MSTPATTLYTRCPGCATIFRVSPQQLALREGQVRCGHCRAVFDAHRERVSLDAPRGDDDDHDELAAGRPTVTLRSAEALQPVEPKGEKASTEPAETVPSPVETGQAPAAPVETERVPVAPAGTAEDEPSADSATTDIATTDIATTDIATTDIATTDIATTDIATTDTAPTDAVTTVSSAETMASADEPETSIGETATSEPALAPIRIDDVDLRASRFEWKPRKPLRERPTSLYATAIVVLVLALMAQALFEYRDALAAHASFTRPVLQAACSAFGCDVGPLRDAAALSIDASDLRADPAHKGLLELSATIRNRAAYPIAWPYLELTLTDVSERVVARRAFPPPEYAGAGADVARGIPANGEDVVRLYLDASATSQSGYRLYLFYP